jgi:hypothetical protein
MSTRAYKTKIVEPVEQVCLYYRGARYAGKGVLTWDWETGHHLESYLERYGPPLPEVREYGRAHVLTDADAVPVRLRLSHGRKALIRGILIRDEMSLIEKKHLSCTMSHLLFIEHMGTGLVPWSGDILLETDGCVILPDTVRRSLSVDGHPGQEAVSRGGLRYLHSDQWLRCFTTDDGCIEVSYRLIPRFWSRAEAWRFSEAVAIALSILSGRTLRLVERSLWRGCTRFIERRKKEPVVNLGYLSFFPNYPLPGKERIVNLIGFLASSSTEAHVCRRILLQTADAIRQTTTQGQVLMCATILEAAVRTLGKHAYVPKDTSWDVQESVTRFRQKYLTEEWSSSCDRAVRVFRRMRNRYAHPDWLVNDESAPLRARSEESFDDLVFLSWFYGYMILALAGDHDIKPVFPQPHSRWRAPITVHRASDASPEKDAAS